MARLRSFVALAAMLSGALQVAALWLLPTTMTQLLVALCGAFYLLLALGLFGVSRFSLFLGIVAPGLRAWFSLWPLPIEVWEQLRILVDCAIALGCIPVLWSSLRPDFQHGRGDSEQTHGDSRA